MIRRPRISALLCLVGVIALIGWFDFKYGNGQHSFARFHFRTVDRAHKEVERVIAAERAGGKHVYTNVQGVCNGVANMIFRIASFYAIGKQLNRLPCLEGKCAESYQKELRSAFPRLNFFPLNKNCPKKKPIAHVPFAKSSPRIFEDPQTLRKHENVTTLHLLTSYLQIHRFFHDVRDEILALFGFSSPLNRKVDEYVRSKLLKTNEERKTTKVCTHIRGTDFRTNKRHPLLASLLEFVVPAIEYVVERAQIETESKNVAVILFSEDAKFVNTVIEQLTMNETVENTRIYYPTSLKRIGYMNLAARYCDFFLLTASGSTFGWWSAYLMSDRKQSRVFYNSRLFKPHRKDSARTFVEADFFPPEWNRLLLVADGNLNRIEWQNRSTPGTHI